MKPPASLKGKWAKSWTEIAARLAAQPDHSPADLSLLTRMLEYRVQAENALKVAGECPFIEGSRGQLVEHPGFLLSARCDGLAISLARQLRITPFTREQVPGRAAPDDPLSFIDELAQRRRLEVVGG